MQLRPVQSKSAQSVITVGFLCANGMPLDRLAVGLEYFKQANLLSKQSQYSVVLQSIDGDEITTSCGMRIAMQSAGDPNSVFQYLLLFGGLRMSSDHTLKLARIARTHLRAGSVVLAVENAVFPLAETRLLEGLTVSVAPTLKPAFKEQFPNVDLSPDDNCVDGRVWTASAGFSVLSLLSRMVSHHMPQSALSELNRQFNFYQPALSCVCHLSSRTPAGGLTGNVTVDRAIQLFQQNLEEPLSLGEIAKSIGISLRQLERHFVSATGMNPNAYYIASRLEQARVMVQATTLSVHEVALAAGFGAYATLSQHYKKRFDLTPIQERRKQKQNDNFYRCA